MSSRTYALLGLLVAVTVLAAFGQRLAGELVFGLGIVAYVVWGQVRYRLALHRIARAREAFDGEALRREVGRLRRYVNELSPLYQQLELERALSFMMEERFAEAEGVLDTLVRERLPPRARVSLLGNLAFCHAHLGRPAEAVEEATESARQAEALGPETHAVHLGILGAAYVHAGQPERALPLLREALNRPEAVAPLRVMRELYLGEALRLLGRGAEAREAYARAQASVSRNPWARRAAAALASLPSAS
jgi:tetratricopeptide (TPR) repeat protein